MLTVPSKMTYPKCNISQMLHFGYVIVLGTKSDRNLGG